MECIIANIGYFLELWMLQLYAGLVWRQKICFRTFSCFLFIVNGVILTGINLGIFPKFLVLMIHILLFGYLWKGYTGSKKEKIAKICMVLISAWGTEMISGVLFSLLRFPWKEAWSLIWINSISLALAWLVIFVVRKRKGNADQVKYAPVLKPILICLLPLCILVFIYFRNQKFKVWYNLFVTIFVFMIIWYLVKLQRAEHKMKQKESELDMNRIYGGLYEDMINNIRRKQHNYKDQLAAIYSSHKTAKSLEELVELQREYCDLSQKDSQYDYILTSCNEPVLAGFLYYKCILAQGQNIQVAGKIHIDQWTGNMKLCELIEILGILFNNAFEKVLENESDNKEINFVFSESEDSFYLNMSNRIERNSRIDLTKIFEMGYSTKGERRGLGLPRAKQICDQYGLEINVLVVQNEEAEIKFYIYIPK